MALTIDDRSVDLFELSDPHDIFREIQAAVVEHDSEPNSPLLFFPLFSLNRLRGWISGENREALRPRPKTGAHKR